MSTTSDRLALLQRTKAGQRALLEGMYPDLDFSTVPFREYGRLFTGRKYVPGFVGGWKGYGRSNAEDPATRDILPDYSGHGRDIKLYNFAFSGMSGWGGYAQNFLLATEVTNTGDITEQTETKITVNNISPTTNAYSVRLTKANYNNTGFYLRAEYSNPADTAFRFAYVSSTGSLVSFKNLNPNGVTYVEPIPNEEWTQIENIYLRILPGTTATIEQLPLYPGALVSDGVDDYGQCIKGFSLPDDYTICAVRKYISGAYLATKSSSINNGSFIFEGAFDTYSFGQANGINNLRPALFTYQTKTSYNGTNITAGGANDTDKFAIFSAYVNGTAFESAALYDLRIYDHSLSAEELQIVRDEMMTDYEKATGGGYR